MKDNSRFLITAGFGSIVIVMILLAVFSLSKFRNVKQAMSMLVEQTNVKMRAVNIMRDTIQTRSLTLRKMQLEKNNLKRKKLFMEFINYTARYQAAINQFQKFNLDREEVKILNALKKSTQLSQPKNLEAAKLLMTNVSGNKLVVMFNEAEQLQNDVFHWLNKMVLLENKYSDMALLQVNEHYKQTRYLLIAMIIVAIIISVLVAVMVIRNVGTKTKKIAYQATHDRLTGLMNREAFEIELTEILENIENQNYESIFFYMDLDHFKIVNDTCGHIAGDQLLGRLPKLFEDHKRQHDSLARLGGDEFGLLLTNCDMENAKKIAQAILKEFDEFEFHWENKVFSIGISIGLVALNARQKDINDLMSEADIACYAAKNKGGNSVQVYDTSNDKIINKKGQMHWLSNINEALKNDKFELFFQPIYPLSEKSGDENYYEVLLRYRDESGEILPTASLMSAAERFGTVDRVDRWVIKNSFIWIKKCQQIEDVKLSINLSGKSLTDDNIIDFIEENINKYDIDARNITFEVTESAAINSIESANRLIVSLKSLGCRFSLDDFGSGYSSFRFLKNFPVDILKIDGGFVRNIATDPVDYAMVKSIHEIGRSMGMITIAEFAETEAIVQKLREIGIDYAQGYAIARPSSHAVAVDKDIGL